MKVLIARVQRLPVATKLSLLRLHDTSRLLCKVSCGRLKWERRRHRLSCSDDVPQRHCFKKNTTSSQCSCKLSKSITSTAIASILVLYWINEIGLVVDSTFRYYWVAENSCSVVRDGAAIANTPLLYGRRANSKLL